MEKPLTKQQVFFVALISVITLFLVVLKIKSLMYWYYTSDLFLFSQASAETFAGQWGRSFVYGNIFGDHAYFFLLILYPFFKIMGSHFVYFLLLLGPIAYFAVNVNALLLFSHLNRSGKSIQPVFLAALVLLLPLGFLEGMRERIYGFHPDIVAAYLGVLIMLLLACILMPEKSSGHSKTNPMTKNLKAMFFALLVFYLSIKEEFALGMALGLFAVYLQKKHKFILQAGFISLAIFLFGLVFIRLNHSVFNRPPQVLWLGLQENLFLNFPQSIFKLPWEFISLNFFFLLITSLLLRKRSHPITLALLIMGLLRLPLPFITSDFNAFSWHSFPTTLFFTGALAHHIVSSEKMNVAFYLGYLSITLSILYAGFFSLPSASTRVFMNRPQTYEQHQKEMRALMPMVRKDRVITVPEMSLIEWELEGHRYAPFPNGLVGRTAGIVHYVILNKSRFSKAHLLPKCFSLRAKTPNYALYEKKGTCKAFTQKGQRFTDRYGMGSIGIL